MSAFDPHPSFQDCVALFHRRNPDFVAVLPCVKPLAPGAGRLGRALAADARRRRIPLDEYLEHVSAEQRYCTTHRDWHHVSAFSDALTQSHRTCKAWRNARERQAPYRQKERVAR